MKVSTLIFISALFLFGVQANLSCNCEGDLSLLQEGCDCSVKSCACEGEENCACSTKKSASCACAGEEGCSCSTNTGRLKSVFLQTAEKACACEGEEGCACSTNIKDQIQIQFGDLNLNAKSCNCADASAALDAGCDCSTEKSLLSVQQEGEGEGQEGAAAPTEENAAPTEENAAVEEPTEGEPIVIEAEDGELITLPAGINPEAYNVIQYVFDNAGIPEAKDPKFMVNVLLYFRERFAGRQIEEGDVGYTGLNQDDFDQTARAVDGEERVKVPFVPRDLDVRGDTSSEGNQEPAYTPFSQFIALKTSIYDL